MPLLEKPRDATHLHRQWKNLWSLVVAFLLFKSTMGVFGRETGYVEWTFLQILFAIAVPITMAYYSYKITNKRSEILINGALGFLQLLFIGPIISYVRLKPKWVAQIKKYEPTSEIDPNPSGISKILIGVIIVFILVIMVSLWLVTIGE